jgi:hypothetical protein
LVLSSKVIDSALHSSTLALCHGNIALDSTKLNIVLLNGSSMLVNQSCVVHLDLIKFSLNSHFFRLYDIKRLSEFLLTIQSFLVLSSELLQLGLKIPVLLLISILALIKGFEALLEPLCFKLESCLFGFEILVLLVTLGEHALKIANLRDERSTNFGGEFDIVNSV